MFQLLKKHLKLVKTQNMPQSGYVPAGGTEMGEDSWRAKGASPEKAIGLTFSLAFCWR